MGKAAALLSFGRLITFFPPSFLWYSVLVTKQHHQQQRVGLGPAPFFFPPVHIINNTIVVPPLLNFSFFFPPSPSGSVNRARRPDVPCPPSVFLGDQKKLEHDGEPAFFSLFPKLAPFLFPSLYNNVIGRTECSRSGLWLFFFPCSPSLSS